MTYIKGGIIQAADYNGFLTSVSNIYGVGSSDRGYGQTTITEAAVAVGGVIRSVQWVNLINMITVCANQQGTAITTLPPTSVLAVGDVIRAHEQASPSSNTYELQGNITLIDTDRLNVSSTSMSVVTNVLAVTRASSWTSSISAQVSVLWSSEDTARYYFNSGGQIRMTGTQPSGSVEDNEWRNTLVNGVGTVKFAAHATTNTGTIAGSQSLGFYGLTDSYQTIYTGSVSAGSSYQSGQTIVIAAKRLNFVGLHAGNGNGVQFQITLTDTAPYASATVDSGTSFSFDNVKATTFLTGILSPNYAIVTNF